MITASDIKKLRDQSGISLGECKKALEEAGGDEAKALEILKVKGTLTAQKKSGRALGAGTIAAYVHTTKAIAAMVMLACETDFVARNDEFISLAYNLAMHVSVTNPADTDALLNEPFIKDENKTVRQLIEEAVQKFGERIEVSRFVQFIVEK